MSSSFTELWQTMIMPISCCRKRHGEYVRERRANETIMQLSWISISIPPCNDYFWFVAHFDLNIQGSLFCYYSFRGSLKTIIYLLLFRTYHKMCFKLCKYTMHFLYFHYMHTILFSFEVRWTISLHVWQRYWDDKYIFDSANIQLIEKDYSLIALPA